MEKSMKKQMVIPNSPSSPLAILNESQTISKLKPKIRIIHIFAPEIIKTDVANFRELVQRLTGKPTEVRECRKRQRVSRSEEDRKMEIPATATAVMSRKGEFRSGFRVKEREEMWNGENSGGYLGGFGDLDGFIQELGEFPLLPLDSNHIQHHAFGESQIV